MNKLSSLSIFFPAYNEEKNIKKSIEKAIEAASKVAHKFEIIVVNDASNDRTAQIVERLKEKYNSIIKLISHSENKGYGGALTTGIQNSQNDYIFFTDADLQFDLNEIGLLTKHVDEYDVVIGYRKNRRDPFIRKLNAKGWNILNRILFNLNITDIDGAFKLMKKEVVQTLPIKSKGAMVSAEMLIHMSQRGVSIKEVPVTHYPRKQGSPTGAKPSVILKAFKEMIGIFLSEVGKPTRNQILTFLTVGILNTAIDIFGYYFLTRNVTFFMEHIVFTKALTFFFGTITSFLLNKYFTFKQKTFNFTEVTKFYAMVLLSISVNAGAVYVFSSIFGLYDLLSVFLATVITFVLNFIGSKIFVFTPVLKNKNYILEPKFKTLSQ